MSATKTGVDKEALLEECVATPAWGWHKTSWPRRSPRSKEKAVYNVTPGTAA